MFARPALFASVLVALALRLGADEPDYAIPYDSLTEAQAALVHDVADRASLSTEFAREEVASSVTTYDYLLDRLPLTARIVRALDLGKYVIKPIEEEECVVLDDREGVKVSLYEVYRGAEKRVYYTKGYYQGPLLPRIHGRGVIVLCYRQEGKAIATSAKLYFRLDSGVARAMTKILYPMVLDVAKDKSAVFIVAAKDVSERVSRDPEGFLDALKETGRFTDAEMSEYKRQILAETSANAQGR